MNLSFKTDGPVSGDDFVQVVSKTVDMRHWGKLGITVAGEKIDLNAPNAWDDLKEKLLTLDKGLIDIEIPEEIKDLSTLLKCRITGILGTFDRFVEKMHL